MFPPVDLTAAPRIRELIALLPESETRDSLAETASLRACQLAEVLEHAATVTARLSEIAEALPDAKGKQADALRTERAELLVQSLALPDDKRVASRRYAESLQDWAAHASAAAHSERQKTGAQLDAVEPEHRAALARLNKMHPGDDAYASAFEHFQRVDSRRKPILDRHQQLRDLQSLIDDHVESALRIDRGQRIKVKGGRAGGDIVTAFISRTSGKAA